MMKREDLSRLAIALNGIPILGCLPGSAAAKAGLRYGDVLLSVNGQSTSDWGAYLEARERVSGQMTIEIFRDGERREMVLDFKQRSREWTASALADELVASRVLPLDGDPFGLKTPSEKVS